MTKSIKNVPQGPATLAERVQAVRDFAVSNYTHGGWDIVVEAMGDDELVEIMGNTKTRIGAIAAVKTVAELLGEHRGDIEGA